MLAQIDNKTYSISEISKLLQIHPGVLRRWEDNFNLNIKRLPSGKRQYSTRNLTLLSDIQNQLNSKEVIEKQIKFKALNNRLIKYKKLNKKILLGSLLIVSLVLTIALKLHNETGARVNSDNSEMQGILGSFVKEGEIEKRTTQLNEPKLAIESSKSSTSGQIIIETGRTSYKVHSDTLTRGSLILATPKKPVAIGTEITGEGTFEITLAETYPKDLVIDWVIIDKKGYSSE